MRKQVQEKRALPGYGDEVGDGGEEKERGLGVKVG